MKIREKIYAIKVASRLNEIVKETNGKPSCVDYFCFNGLKSRVANSIFTKGYSIELYEKFFTKSLDEWVAEMYK